MARISPGVKNKPKLMQDLCSDCGSTDPSWASVNKGILICDGCCSVHRSLGRHLSVVKSLTKGKWHPSELTMVYSLNNSGANNIWEHALLDPSSTKIIRKKPQPTDPIHPTKADFIRAKHQLLSFVYRPTKEENSDMDKDTSKQLHASVRTPNLETSLRLLSLGADPNYLNEDKGNCPLHVAAMTGQGCQVELLVLYGGDPLSLDKDGKTPIDYARENGFNDIADRLIGLQYELTDRLSFYLCGRSPDHATGQHWVIPDLVNSESTQQAQLKLIALPNQSLKQLACDIYDEVDRRELDAVWLSLQSNQSVNSTKSQSSFVSDRCSVPFLPVNPELSSTRNQGRQKLARFNSQEFSVIVFDVLTEIQRRMTASLSSIVTSNDKFLLTKDYSSSFSRFDLTSLQNSSQNLVSTKSGCVCTQDFLNNGNLHVQGHHSNFSFNDLESKRLTPNYALGNHYASYDESCHNIDECTDSTYLRSEVEIMESKDSIGVNNAKRLTPIYANNMAHYASYDEVCSTLGDSIEHESTYPDPKAVNTDSEHTFDESSVLLSTSTYDARVSYANVCPTPDGCQEQESAYRYSPGLKGPNIGDRMFSAHMPPILGSQKSKKKKVALPKFNIFGGNETNWKNNYVGSSSFSHSSPNNYSFRMLRRDKNKPRKAWSFGDFHPRKFNVIHPSSDTKNIASENTPSTSSFFVRTFTMPLKVAAQKQRRIQEKVLSRSQPTSPVVSRKLPVSISDQRCSSSFAACSNDKEFLKKKKRGLFSSKQNNKLPCPDDDIKCTVSPSSFSSLETPYSASAARLLANQPHSTPKSGNDLASLISSTAEKKIISIGPEEQLALGETSQYSPPVYRRSPWNKRHSNVFSEDVILETCDICAQNLADGVQQFSIWESAFDQPSYARSESPRKSLAHCDHHSLTETSANQFADRNNAFRQTCPAGSRKNRPQLTKCPQNRSSLNYNYHLLTANTTDTLTASSTSVSSSPRSFTLQKSSNVTKSSIFPSNITDPILLSSTSHTSHTSLPFVPSPLGNEEECEPVYDSVASEDDYSSLERRRMNHQGKFLENQNTSLENQLKSDYDEVHEECTKNAESMKSNEDGTSQSSLPVSIEEYLGMKRHLETSELQIRELQQSNIAMTAKLDELTSIVFHLKEENDSLRFYDSSKSHLPTKQSAIISPHFTPTHRNHHTYAPQEPRSLSPHFCNSSTTQRYNNCDRNSEGHYEVSSFNNQSELDASSEYFSLLSSLPSQDEVVRKTELITRRIQDLLQAAQESEYDKFIPCSEQIIFAVKEMTTLFPKNGSPPIISQAIHQLSMSACRLQSECRNHISSQLHLLDPGTVTQQVIQCAYDIAKAAKSLVTHFQ